MLNLHPLGLSYGIKYLQLKQKYYKNYHLKFKSI